MALTDKLTAIADAIRAKTGETGGLTLEQMPSAIASIETGGGGGSVDGYCTVTFMNGGDVLFSRLVMSGDDCPDPVAQGHIDTPIKESTNYYEYPLKGWATTDGGAVDDNALKDIREDRTLYAVLTETERLYTIKFYDDEGKVYVTQKLTYGATPSYTPADRAGYAFEGWSPSISAVTGDANYYAVWTETEVAVVEITDSWDEIIAAVNDGTYKTKYKLGNYKALDGFVDGNNQTVKMQIVAKNGDALADGSGTAAITWVAMTSTKTSYVFNSQSSPQSTTDAEGNRVYVAGTYDYGGWEACELRNVTMPELKALMPANVQAAIKPVSKTSITMDIYGKVGCVTTADDVWIPSSREVLGTWSTSSWGREENGPMYSAIFCDTNSLKRTAGGTNRYWRLRTPRQNSMSYYGSMITINENGEPNVNYSVGYGAGVVFGFCI